MPDAVPPSLPLPIQPVEGPSYPLLVKLTSAALVLAIGVMGLAPGGRAVALALPLGTQVLMGSALAIALVSLWSLLRSRTAIDGRCIRQTWLWRLLLCLGWVDRINKGHTEPGRRQDYRRSHRTPGRQK